jgi:hypothetical protein
LLNACDVVETPVVPKATLTGMVDPAAMLLAPPLNHA